MKKSITAIIGIILFSTTLNSQSNSFDNYQKLWEAVEQFELKGLPKSALAEVEKIYQKAKKANNHPQLIKTLLYKSKFALTLEEDAQLKVINDLKSEISQNTFPTKNILESILADIYWQYFQQNRWKFYNRTNTAEKVDSTDFRTWDLQTLFEETHTHYQKSLENALEAQQVHLDQFNDILHVQPGSRLFRPKLYDFLAHRALDFYKNDERNLKQPAYKFEIENPDLLGSNNDFVKVQITAKDSLSQQLQALRIYKNLTLFHNKFENPSALVNNTLERLDFVRANAVFNDKESVYLNTLQQLKTDYKDHEISAEIDYKIALFFNNEANTFKPQENETDRWKRKEALQICEAAIAKFPTATGTQKCKRLKSQILQQSLQLTAEQFVPIHTPSRILTAYKNTEELYFTVFEISKKEQQKFNEIYNESAKLVFINKLKSVKNWKTNLRNESDFQEHQTEVLLPELAQGNYLIFASPNSEINTENTFGYSFIQITDLALIENKISDKHVYQVVDRNTGKPIENAQVHIKNYNTGRYNAFIEHLLTTNSNGQVAFTVNTNHSNVVATITHGKDKAVFGDYYLSEIYKPRRDNTTNTRLFLFTDRSIYRPGQTVYFKGIAVAMKANKSDVLENKKVSVTLKDVNYQDVKTLELKTNAFGSFSGEFILPSTGLTGNFNLHATGNTGLFNKTMNGSVHFSVEEYKRPKFETTFKPVTETYRLNDSIRVNGFATAFAGSTITDAKVVYRVVRTAQYPKWYWYYRPSISSDEQEITHGESSTDALGNFNITFKALPDLKVSKESQPTFNYRVFADVTDINGETRSAETLVNVGYHALDVSLSIADKLDKTKKAHSIGVTTNNLNGQFVPTTGTLKIYKLKAPQQVLRKRPWAAPDYPGFSKETFTNLFPHDAYQNEDKSDNWEKGALVFETVINTEKTKEIEFKNSRKWLSGKYIAVLECQDKFGQNVKDEQRFDLFSDKDETVADKALFFVKTDKTSYTPEDLVELTLGSASQNATVTVTVEKNYTIVSTEVIHISNEVKTLKIPVDHKDLGGFAIHYHLVNYNAFTNGTLNINVPYPKQELDIETTTFRDKLQPGQNETWSFKLKGSKSDKVAAEILASMYDASLDQFKPHNWGFNPIGYQYYYSYTNSNANNSFGTSYFNIRQKNQPTYGYSTQSYDQLNWFGFSFGNSNNYMTKSLRGMVSGVQTQEDSSLDEVVVTGYGKSNQKLERSAAPEAAAMMVAEEERKEIVEEQGEKTSLDGIVARKNLQETAFFYPHLQTDAEGTISFNFTVPESLTRWKLQLLAHTKDLATTTKQLTAVTQKELMVLPNPPRFLREGDQIIFASKIANLTDNSLNGISELQLFDALTNKPIDAKLGNANNHKNFTVAAKGNANVSWTLQIPDDVQAVKYKIVAKAGDFTDGEENALPVLSNRMLVTETLPMWLRSNQTKTFTLDKLKNNTSTTLKNHKLTLEVTSNPAWYAVQALPYLMEYPYECAEQTFSRYYANALASHIANSNPRIQEVFNQWASSDALLSNLEKNQELKSMIIEETPWLRDAQSETEQKKRIALLFDLNKMKNELESAARKLSQMQMSDGGFPWFKGSRYPNRYITQHIASGFGHLKQLNVILNDSEESMLNKAVKFLDDELLNDYKELEKQAKRIRESAKTKTQGLKDERIFWAQNNTGNFQIQYLYMRSFYKDLSIATAVQKAVDYYTNQAYTFWLDNSLYTKGMIALIAKRNDNAVAKKIIASLKENAISNEELGMYWKANTSGYYWYQAPIETQALLIEAFSEVEGDTKTVDELKIWLLKNKQTNRWKSTKATTEAVYALLLQGTDWLEVTDFVDVQIGDAKINPLTLEDTKVEAGTGYFKTSWSGSEITPNMAEVTLSKKSAGIAWGALYWQYFEDLDKITSAETPLQLKKKLFLKQNTDKGEELTEINANSSLKLGDLVRVRIELKVDRAMEFVHMKDMRAAGFEPVNVLSQYKWQDNLGYYESTKDAATNFFFDRLPKGVYVFEYDLRVNNKGDFSNGITTIQSMYAPEFSSHSEGVRVNVGG
tara:strand:+ start:283180 stop:289320 length:6141 start_codon:yes stop_codon:yes gene_type:complete